MSGGGGGGQVTTIPVNPTTGAPVSVLMHLILIDQINAVLIDKPHQLHSVFAVAMLDLLPQ